jgi:hypothetical protein
MAEVHGMLAVKGYDPMPDLLKKPFGSHGKVHQITPESAGWRARLGRFRR